MRIEDVSNTVSMQRSFETVIDGKKVLTKTIENSFNLIQIFLDGVNISDDITLSLSEEDMKEFGFRLMKKQGFHLLYQLNRKWKSFYIKEEEMLQIENNNIIDDRDFEEDARTSFYNAVTKTPIQVSLKSNKIYRDANNETKKIQETSVIDLIQETITINIQLQ